MSHENFEKDYEEVLSGALSNCNLDEPAHNAATAIKDFSKNK
jgi:hypothetical protein